MPSTDYKNLPEKEEDIDFTDIEEKYQVTVDNDFDTIIVVDGAPIVDEKKEEKLLTVLRKEFTKHAGEIKENGMWMPMVTNSEGKKESKGYLFIDFETKDAALAAVKNMDGYKMSKKNKLLVNKFSDVEKYTLMDDKYVEPPQEEFTPKEHLRSWLMDPQARDQFVMYRGDDVGICWNRKTDVPEEVFGRNKWTESYVQWSPLGSYLATFHAQGIALWGGPSWSRIVRFPHPGVRLLDFSPNERYMVTWSTEPINLATFPPGQSSGFSEYDEGNHVCIWDIKTGTLLRSFPMPHVTEKQEKITVGWPMFKWAPSEKYCARVVPGEQLSIYEAPSMGLLDKKSIKIPGIVGFEWSPVNANKSDTKLFYKDDLLAYWTPEVGNQPARVTMMTVPNKEIIRTKNLFNVRECKMLWQSQGKFLAVKVDRHTKTKRSIFANLEIFRVNEKDIPVETLEVKDPVLLFAWEPNGERFAIITTDDPNLSLVSTHGQNAHTIKTSVTFYYLDKSKALASFQQLKRLDKKTANTMFWSPKGRHIVLATINNATVFDLEFWDLDFEPLSQDTTKKEGKGGVGTTVQHSATQEHYHVSDVEWDPTGRYVVSVASYWRYKFENGYCIWDFKGALLYKQNIERFKQLLWRPRPKSLLSTEQKKKIRKNMRQYSKLFDEEDLAAGDANAARIIAARRKAIEEWYAWRRQAEKQLAEERVARGLPPRSTIDEGKSEVIEEWVEEVIDEVEEILE